MNTLYRLTGIASGLVVLACILACGATAKVREASERMKRSNDLKQIGLTYINFFDNKKKPPANLNELITWAGQNQPEAVAVLQQAGPGGAYVILWNVDPIKQPAGSSNTVLGHESKVPGAQGLVLMADGAVHNLSPAEFAAKAQPKTESKAAEDK
jgi:hypothetical protein